MRTYIDEYLKSLTDGEQIAATRFIYTDRIRLQESATGITDRISAVIPILPRVASGQVFDDYSYISLFSKSSSSMSEIFDQANLSAGVRSSINDMAKSKLANIQAALTQLGDDIYNWEEIFSCMPDATKTIHRSFGPDGMRPIWVKEGSLSLLSTTIEANSPYANCSGLIVAEPLDAITNDYFSTEDGLQVRLTYMFSPGPVDTIKLEPLSSLGDTKVVEGRLYDTGGNLVSTFVEDLILTKTMWFSIERTTISRIEIDLLDVTYQLVDQTRTLYREVEERTVIPAWQEKVITGWEDIPTTNRPTTPDP